MIKEIYTAALGMVPQQTRLEITANNIANANTTGYKRIGVFEQSLIDARENMLNTRGDVEQEDPPTQQYTDYTQGALTNTGNPLDLALDREGFFVLHDKNGDESFVRGGHFEIGSDGTIVTPDGKTLMGDSGPLVVNRTNQQGFRNDERTQNIRINDNGEVFADNQFVGRVQVMNVENPQTLARANNSGFRPTDQTNYAPMQADSIRLKQGYLEASNVNIIGEMVAMIQLQRAFEMGQKVITTNDGTLERSIDIGRFS